MPQYEFEVLERIEAGETAWEILDETLPTARRRFNRICATMKKLLDDVQREFPDATYYSDSGTLHLLIGNSHGEDKQPQTCLIAETASNGLIVCGGGW